jgi:PTS system ascorbate-specific IIB component
MGTSLMLRMTAEDALRDLGVEAKVEATDVSSARGMSTDVIIGQGMHAEEFVGAAPVVIGVSNFMDKEGLKARLAEELRGAGWLA